MASCPPFSVNFSGTSQDLLAKVTLLITSHGGQISGSSTGGVFSVPVPVFGSVEGSYQIQGQVLTITITKRSFFLACGTIESFVRNHIPAVEQANFADLA